MQRSVRRLAVPTMLALGVLTFAGAPAMAQEGGAAAGRCAPTKLAYKVSPSSVVTTSRKSAMKVQITAPVSRVPTCAIVTVSSTIATQDALSWEVSTDNDTNMASPSPVWVVDQSTGGVEESRSFTFVLPALTSGDHIVELFVASGAGGEVRMRGTGMYVQY